MTLKQTLVLIALFPVGTIEMCLVKDALSIPVLQEQAAYHACVEKKYGMTPIDHYPYPLCTKI